MKDLILKNGGFNLSKLHSILIVGGCGTGKSTFISDYIHYLQSNDPKVEIIHFDPKGVEHQQFKNLRRVYIDGCYIDSGDSKTSLKSSPFSHLFKSLLTNRSKKDKPLYIFVDELGEYLLNPSNYLDIKKIINLAEELNIYLIAGLQSNALIKEQLKESFTSCINLR